MRWLIAWQIRKLRARARARKRKSQKKSCIFVFSYPTVSHVLIYTLKPNERRHERVGRGRHKRLLPLCEWSRSYVHAELIYVQSVIKYNFMKNHNFTQTLFHVEYILCVVWCAFGARSECDWAWVALWKWTIFCLMFKTYEARLPSIHPPRYSHNRHTLTTAREINCYAQ